MNLLDFMRDDVANRDGAPFVATSQTSRNAATAIEPHAETQRRSVLDYLRSVDGATRQEIETATGICGDAVRPRVAELRKAHLVIETTDTRLTTSGRRAFVLRAAK